MRRGGSDSDSRKAGSDASSDNDNSINTSASQKTTFEEREAAYNEARARIFKDFVESPPDTPPPGKQEKSRRQDKNDDFSGRSQFYPVMQPIQAQYYPQQGYHDALMQTAMQQPMLPTMAQLQQQQMQQQHHVPSQQRFNPTANFTPSNFTPPQQFSPSAPPFSTIPPSRSYPNFNTARERGYPAPIPQHQTQPPHQQQQVYPQQPNGYYPPPQTPPTMHGTRSYNPGHPQPPMMQSSYSSSGGFPQQQAQFNNPATTPPPINRQLQQQQQYPMHHTNQHQSFTPQRMPQQPQPQHQPLGWGGVAMAPRSSSAPGHQLHHTGLPESHAHAAIGTGMNGYGGGAVGTGAWGSGGGVAWNGGNVVGRGGGVGGGGMNMRM